MQNPGSTIQDPEQDPGSRIQAFKLQDPGLQDPASGIQDPVPVRGTLHAVANVGGNYVKLP